MGKGGACKVVDGVLFVYFVVIAVVPPLLDLPGHVAPPFAAELKRWYAQTYDDYLFTEKPHFFVGLVCLELLFQWPLAIASLYAIAANKSWFSTTALIYGVSNLSFSAALLFEMTLSKRASSKMFAIYYGYLGFGLLALFRGLFTTTVDKGKEGHKKRA